jgi:hypothetical protein
MSLIGDLGDPKKDVEALEPMVQRLQSSLGTDLVNHVIPALQQALENALDGLTITITISRKPPVVESPK